MTNSLVVKIGSDISDLRTGMNRAQGLVQEFQNTVSSVAGTLGVAFGVQQVTTFGLELVKLAGQADGVKQAFDKLPGSTQALKDLQAATKGTVSDFDLMKAAVQANNFKIPLEQLGSLFDFAYERAKATGQSVDYLVNSIVVGIGRKSPLILDNLGISAVELKEKLKGVSSEAATVGDVANAVGQIASEAMSKMGKSAETASEKISQIATQWENIKEKLGKGIAGYITGSDPNALLTNFHNQLIVWQSDQVSFWEKLTGSAKDYADIVERLNALQGKMGPSPYQSGVQAIGPNPNSPVQPGDADAARAMRHRNSPNPTLPTTSINTIEVAQPFLDLANAIDGVQKKADAFNMENLGQQMEYANGLAKEQAAVWAQIGDSIGSAVGAAITGSQSIAKSFGQMAVSVVSSLERMALAYMIENNARYGLPGIAMAAIGFAAIKALFSSIGGGSGGGSGGVGVGVVSAQRTFTPTQSPQLVTYVSGSNLAIVLQRYYDQNSYTRPPGG